MSERIVREPERREVTGICRTAAYELEKRGLFPRRVVLTGGRVGWKLSELLAWIGSRPTANPEVAVSDLRRKMAAKGRAVRRERRSSGQAIEDLAEPAEAGR